MKMYNLQPLYLVFPPCEYLKMYKEKLITNLFCAISYEVMDLYLQLISMRDKEVCETAKTYS
jgi:hypothetical protein